MDYKDIIISQLDILRKDEIKNKEPFKARAYQTVINNLKSSELPIYTLDDIKNISGIGDKIYEKIKTIIESQGQHLKRVDKILNNKLLNNSSNHKYDIIQELTNIYGVGPVKAKELVENEGVKSVLDLKEKVKKNNGLLNQSQKIGLQYYEDLLERIPRSEMDKHCEYILNTIKKESNSKLVCSLAGSYRRGLESSGDIDVIITASNVNTTYIEMVTMYNNCVNKMLQDKYVVVVLAKGPKKVLAICNLNNNSKSSTFSSRINRRIDLLLTLQSEFYYSLLYFTGSQQFNIKMRSKALELGYSLNEHTLSFKDKEEKNKIKPPTMRSEKDIFDFLKMEYVRPEERK